MKPVSRVLLAALTLSSQGAFADNYIVLFKSATEAVNLPEDQVQEVLMKNNDANVGVLKDWMTRKNIANGEDNAKIENLWIAQGAVVDVTSAQAKQIATQPFVASVVKDKIQKYLDPQGQIKADSEVKKEDLWGLDAINLKSARTAFPNTFGQGVTVGILDTGIESGHPEFGDLSGVVFKDFVSGLDYPYDDHGHGTHVAGTIAGGRTGIAPQAKLVVAKGLNAIGSGYDTWLLRAMQWFADPDGNPRTKDQPRLVSNSWGGGLEGKINTYSEYASFARAVDNWVALGITPVFAAGNSGVYGVGFPGGFKQAIAVGAYDNKGDIASFSSRGPVFWIMSNAVESIFKPEVSAPGVGIGSSFPGGKYATWNGTSMATPHVAGALALAMQTNQKLKHREIQSVLLRSVEPKYDVAFGAGKLNVLRLLQYAKNSN